jgi:penicillin-binding protein 1A
MAARTSRLRTWLRAPLRWGARGLALGAVLLLLGGGIGYYWLYVNILSDLPSDLATYRDYRPPTTCRVYASNGDLVDEFYVERRTWVDIDSLPPHVWQAFVSAEDRRFFEHPGVDLLGILRAVEINFQAGGASQGGSTITQQLVKNLITGDERSLRRKLKEAILAYRLERELSKMEILQLYINYVFLGSGNYGIEAAAEDYYGVPAKELDPGQAALIAGLIPAPSRYSPRRNPDMAREKRAAVLRAMVDEGYVDPIDAIDYASDPVLYTPKGRGASTNVATAYVTLVRREIRRVVGEETAFREGLSVYTPLDLDLQEVAVGAVEDAVEAHEKRQGIRPVSGHLAPTEFAGFLTRGEGLRADGSGSFHAPRPKDCFPAVIGYELDLHALRAGPFSFPMSQAALDTPVFTGQESGPKPFRKTLTGGEVVQVCLDDYGALELDARPWAVGAAVVVENATGRILALTSGPDTQIEGFVRAAQARRQPGSSFKPYVYSTALRDGRTQLDIVQDAPIFLPGGNGKMWSPKNYGGGYAGSIQLRQALARSLNTVSVRLALASGPAEIAQLAHAMGVQTPLRTDITIALGSSEVTPLDQAMGYATLARMGVPVDPVYIDRLEDVDGRIVGSRGGPITLPEESPRDGSFQSEVAHADHVIGFLPGGPKQRVLPAGTAYEMVDMMREVVRAGTARKAYKPGFDRGGKTGTTNDYVDAWFVGITPRWTIAVWIGTDGTQTLGDSETGGRTALPAWVAIADALPSQEGETFAIPDEAILVKSGDRWVGIDRGRVPSAVLKTPDPKGEPLPSLSR